MTQGLESYYLNILNRCANRESTPQFFDKLPGVNEQYFQGRTEVSNQDFLGLVLDYDNTTNIATLEVRNYFEVGDEVQFFGPNIETFNYTINKMYNEDNELIDVARHPKSIIKMKIDKELEKNYMMRIKVFDKDNFL